MRERGNGFSPPLRVGLTSLCLCASASFCFPRADFMKLLILSLICCPVLASMANADEPGKARPPVKVTDEALRIHRSAILVDGHNDLPWQFREKKDFGFKRLDITRVQKELHT